MKVLFVFLFLTQAAFANCKMSFEKPSDGGMSSTFVTDSLYKNILKTLSKKGYEVFEPRSLAEKADYNLMVEADYGYGCGTGLTWVDYLVVPAYFTVELSSPEGVIFQKEKSFSAPVDVRGLAKRKLMRAIRSLPECHE
jgi:hypothetical protein